MPGAAEIAGRAAVSPARLCAYRVVRRVVRESAFADRAFRAEATRARLDARDRAFAQQLAYGTVQRLRTLDHVIGAVSNRPLEEIDAPLLDALRLGAFQLLHMGGVPDHAAVEQTVELAKLESRGGHRFANALMRRAAIEGPALLATLDAETPERAAILHSHPEWVAALWWELLGGEQATALMARDNQPAESAVRANTLRVTAGELAAELAGLGVPNRPAAGLEEGLVLDGPFDLHDSELFAAGALMPQSRASMQVARVLAPRAGERVLDMCAAPGAKTTHIAALMEGRGEIVAVERNERRAEELAANCRRLGAGNVRVAVGDARAPLPGPPFDRVLLDPPCSGLGTLQARPDARWRASPGSVDGLVPVQGALLAAAAAAVRPGGTLVYSTCTISPRENEDQMPAFVKAHPQFTVEDLGAELPWLASRRDSRCLLLLPHRDETDGFFIARLTRQGDGR